MRCVRVTAVCTASAAVALTMVALTVVAQDRSPTPRFDPFDRSSLQGGPMTRSRGVGWTPWLKATLVAGERSMANLGGVLLRVGQETHGYHLVEVREWEAVFAKEGETVVLAVIPPIEVEP